MEKWPVTTLVLSLGFEVRWVTDTAYGNGCQVRDTVTKQVYYVHRLSNTALQLIPTGDSQ